jgi:nicotinamide-nucleotide amidase
MDDQKALATDATRQLAITCELLVDIAKDVMKLAGKQQVHLVTAESCTSGLLVNTLSEAPGAAQLLHGGFVTYTKTNKTAVLGVPANLLAEKGAVGPEVAARMAEGALADSPADLAAAITGVAGPDPDEDGNPVGLVWIAVLRRGQTPALLQRQYGDQGRDVVRRLAVRDALVEIKKQLDPDRQQEH